MPAVGSEHRLRQDRWPWRVRHGHKLEMARLSELWSRLEAGVWIAPYSSFQRRNRHTCGILNTPRVAGVIKIVRWWPKNVYGLPGRQLPRAGSKRKADGFAKSFGYLPAFWLLGTEQTYLGTCSNLVSLSMLGLLKLPLGIQ